jgi:hypothetical protein
MYISKDSWLWKKRKKWKVTKKVFLSSFLKPMSPTFVADGLSSKLLSYVIDLNGAIHTHTYINIYTYIHSL